MTGAAVVAENASKLFLDGSVVAFQALTLTVPEHDVLCIVGPSGCGKTTFLRCVAGLTEVSTGRLFVHGQPVTGPPEGVAMVFQQFGLLPWKTVYDNAAFGLAMAGAILFGDELVACGAASGFGGGGCDAHRAPRPASATSGRSCSQMCSRIAA